MWPAVSWWLVCSGGAASATRGWATWCGPTKGRAVGDVRCDGGHVGRRADHPGGVRRPTRRVVRSGGVRVLLPGGPHRAPRLFWVISRDDPGLRRQLVRFVPSVLVGTTLLLVASRFTGPVQTLLWAAALLGDYLGTVLA